MSEADREWMLMNLDEKMARRQGMPFRVPVPKEEFEGLADKGLPPDQLREWIQDFLTNSPPGKDGNWRRRNAELVSQMEGFVDKTPLWEKAQKMFQENDFEKALKTLRRITVMCPEDHAAKMNYASALANRGEHDKAMKTFKQIRDTFKGEADFHLSVAQIHVARGDGDAAIEELLVGLESQPDHLGSMDALSKLGLLTKLYENPRDASSLTYVRSDSLLDYLKERWDEEERDEAFYLEQLGYHEGDRRYHVALEAADRVLAVDAGNERASIGKINALRGLGRNDDALSAAEAFAAAAAESAAARVELAKCHIGLGNQEAANAAIDQALEVDAGDQEALVLRFWPADRGDMMEVQNAIPGLTKHAEAHPSTAGAWRSLARAKLVCRSDDEALELFQKAVDLSPGDDDLRSEWWSELASKTRYDEIVADAEKLRDMKGRDCRLRWNEAEAYRGLKRIMEARACYTQINSDESLHVDIRKRAKRAVMEMGGAAPGGG
jgi:tetratricopeptide (TPR) repeat protein